MEVPAWAFRLAVVLAALGSGGLVVALARPRGRWGHRLRSRWLLGVPWGSLATIGVVVGFYLVVQGGLDSWYNPLVIPFRAWSYFYPLGVLTAGLAHAGEGHLVGNVLGILVFGSLAEFAWSHFPTDRGGQSFRSLLEHPGVRALAVPAACVTGAVLSGAFGLGPVIGFSGVVFAAAGFALVRFPVATVAALVGSNLVTLLYRSLQRPVVNGSSGVSFSTPWWADIAIQGHALGLFVGLAAGIVLFRRRGTTAPAAYVWFALLAFAASKGLWAVYLIRGGGRYTLFRAGGIALLFIVAALVVTAARASDRDLVSSIGLTRREAAIGLMFGVLLALAVVAVPYNLLTIEDGTVDTDGATVEIRDYTVLYAEDVQDRFVAAYDLPVVDTSGVTSSGVIVLSERRNIWWEAVSKSRLAFAGRRTVSVGGLGWRERVVANRTGWSANGGSAAYKVYLGERGSPQRLAYTSEPATADPTIQGRNISVAPTDEGFELVVARDNETLGRTTVPGADESRFLAGLTFVRQDQAIYATANGTRVRVATKESYNG